MDPQIYKKCLPLGVRALAIGCNPNQLVGPRHTERTKKRHEHFDLQVGWVTTKVWHRDHMKVVEDLSNRDSAADVKDHDGCFHHMQ